MWEGGKILVVNHGVKMWVKWWKLIHALGGIIGLLLSPLPLGPGELGDDSCHD